MSLFLSTIIFAFSFCLLYLLYCQTCMTMTASASKIPPDKKEAPRLQLLLFRALEADGSNYMEWSVDAKTHLTPNELDNALTSPMPAHQSAATKCCALVLLRRHLDDSLRQQYIQIVNPVDLWQQLATRFQHEKTIFLPQARNNWINLRVLDFSDLASFNTELHRIIA